MEDKKKEPHNKKKEEESYWDTVRHFNLSRTPFWVSFGFQLIQTIIPWLVVWLLVGKDFKSYSFNYYNQLPEIKDGVLAAICISMIIWALLIATITFLTKLQKADVYTYTITLSVIFFAIIMNGCWLVNANMNETAKVFTRFIICLFSAIPAMLVGVITTTFARNFMYKIEEDDEAILIAYQNGEPVPSKDMLKIERAEKARIKREQEQKELEEFRENLNRKLDEQFEHQGQIAITPSKEEDKKKKKLAKLDAKEAKQREKFNKKNKDQ